MEQSPSLCNLFSFNLLFSFPSVPFLETPKYAPHFLDGMLNQPITAGLQHPHPLLRAKSENTMTTLMDPVVMPTAAASMPPAQVALNPLLAIKGTHKHRHQSPNHSFSLVSIRLNAGPLSLWGAPAVPVEPEPGPRLVGGREERRRKSRKSSKSSEGGRGENGYIKNVYGGRLWPLRGWFSKADPVKILWRVYFCQIWQVHWVCWCIIFIQQHYIKVH